MFTSVPGNRKRPRDFENGRGRGRGQARGGGERGGGRGAPRGQWPPRGHGHFYPQGPHPRWSWGAPPPQTQAQDHKVREVRSQAETGT